MLQSHERARTLAHLPRLRLVALGAALGGGAGLGQAPFGAWPLSLVAFALVIGIFTKCPTPRRAALLGWSVGLGYFACALHWIVEPFLVDVARHGWMAPFALVTLSGGLALLWAGAFSIAHRAATRSIALIAALPLAEAVRGFLFTGFPWAQPGHALIDTGLLMLAAWAGALGLTLVVLLLALTLWRALAGGRIEAALLAAGLAAYLIVPTPAPAPVAGTAPTIRLIQPNAPQHQKWDPAMIPVFYQRQLDYTAAPPEGAAPDLIVWPETAIPVLLNNAAPTLAQISAAAGGTPVVVGAQRLDGVRLYNALTLLDETGAMRTIYDKHHLVPFGEYIPFGTVLQRFGLRGLAAQDGHGYSAGRGPTVIDIPGVGEALPLICYEGVFPRNLLDAPERADVILLITNDAWFGTFSGPYQHVAQARLRSVEQGLPMIRVANTGVSAMIDAQGHIRASIPLGEAGFIDAPLPDAMPKPLYARTGDPPMWIVLLLMLGGAYITRTARPRDS